MELNVEALQVNIGVERIVRGVSLRAKGPCFVGLLGPNGSGKTTLLKAVYRVLRPSGGTVWLGGEDLSALSERARAKKMAVVAQFNDIAFEFSVEDVVMMGRTPHKGLLEGERAPDRAIVADALERVGMTAYAQRRFSTLSGGEKQRVVLARALAQQPEVLILDEPTNHLDIKYQLLILSIARDLGICVVAALHDLSLAAMFCDEIYLLKAGLLVASGPPREVITPDMIRQVYDVEAQVFSSDETGHLEIRYIIPKKENKEQNNEM